MITSYGMTYCGGFALPRDNAEMMYLMQQNSDIEIRETSSPWCSYEWACSSYVDKKLNSTHNLKVLVATFDAICQMPFLEPGFMPIVPNSRNFAIINQSYVGVYDNIEGSIEFLDYFHPTLLKEFQTESEAKWWINYNFLRYILPMSAYIDGEIPYIKEMPLNKAVPVHFFDWTKQNCILFENGLEFRPWQQNNQSQIANNATPMQIEAPDPMNVWLAEPNSDK